MSMVFLIPLAIALVTTWVSTNASDETTSDLAGSATVGSIIFSLVLAPWQIKLLLLLILLLVTTKRFKLGETTKVVPEAQIDAASIDLTQADVDAPEAEKQQELCYRGVSYGLGSSKLPTSEVEARGAGQDLTPLCEQPSEHLKYRGTEVSPLVSLPDQGLENLSPEP